MNEIFFEGKNFQDINKILEFDNDFVAEFCSPEREMCNTRFEFTVDNFCFLGLPINSRFSRQMEKIQAQK